MVQEWHAQVSAEVLEELVALGFHFASYGDDRFGLCCGLDERGGIHIIRSIDPSRAPTSLDEPVELVPSTSEDLVHFPTLRAALASVRRETFVETFVMTPREAALRYLTAFAVGGYGFDHFQYSVRGERRVASYEDIERLGLLLLDSEAEASDADVFIAWSTTND